VKTKLRPAKHQAAHKTAPGAVAKRKANPKECWRRERKSPPEKFRHRREIYDGQVCALSLSFEQLIASSSAGKLISAQMFTVAATSTPQARW